MLNKFFLHQEVVFYPLKFELPQPAFGDRGDFMRWIIPNGSLDMASIPLPFFLRPTLGGGGTGFFLAGSLPFLFCSFLLT